MTRITQPDGGTSWNLFAFESVKEGRGVTLSPQL